ncbi:MAG: gliding motility lipoprotein GldH [Bacteroidales bacterium]|nr:gliding motility lipoprotein GldH [Bacteroidales bacterium]
MNKIYKGSLIIILLVFFISCNSNRVFDRNIPISKNTWSQDNILTFQPEVLDTSSIYNIFIQLRNTGEYPMSNLFLFIKTTSPQGLFVKDTFECILADPKGKWTGKGFGNVWNNKIMYKQYVKFPFKGTYTIDVEQAMRIEELEGIIDLGIRIEKAAY